MGSDSKNNSLIEDKVLILYVLGKIKDGIIEDGLYQIVNSINNMNYFYFKDRIMELINSRLIGVYATEDSEEIIKITQEGKESLKITQNELPGLVKLKADNVYPKELSSIMDQLSITAEFTPKSENEYIIKCKITEKNETIFEVKTYAGTQERAQEIVDNWQKNASKIYPQILDILLKDYNNEKDEHNN